MSELLSFVRNYVDIDQICDVQQEDWFWVTYEVLGRALLHKRYNHLDLLWLRGIERQTQHPIDFLHEFKTTQEKTKGKIFLTVPKPEELRVVKYDETIGQTVLELFDYCQSVAPIYSSQDVLTFNSLGQIENTPFHWYQLLYNYIVPVILYDKAYVCQPHTELDYNKYFGWTCRMVYSLRNEDPVAFVKKLYEKRISNIPFYDRIEDYMKTVSKHEKSKIQTE